MNKVLNPLAVIAACALGCFTTSVQATPLVTNGSFEATTLTTKGTFLNHVTGWSGGGNLTFLDFPGTATTAYLAVYPGLSATSPDGGNFVEMDGASAYSGAISQTLSGLKVGDTYTVTFDQAAGQQAGFTGPTTELWKVSFGTDSQLSDKYSLAQGATGAWEKEAMTFTANAVSEVLAFLAVGTPNGEPPISFLDGVAVSDTTQATSVPEVSSWAIFASGLALVGIVGSRRRRSE